MRDDASRFLPDKATASRGPPQPSSRAVGTRVAPGEMLCADEGHGIVVAARRCIFIDDLLVNVVWRGKTGARNA
jgi:hypothetical protein